MPFPFRFVLFIVIASALVGWIHSYLYRRLIRDVTSRPLLRWAGGAALGFLAAGLLLARMLRYLLPHPIAGSYTLGIWIWLALATYLFLFFAGVDLFRAVRRVVARVKTPASNLNAPVDAERRQMISRTLAGSALLASGSMVGYGSWRAFHAPVISEISIHLPNLPRALDGLTLVQVTDIHVGAVVERRFLEEMVRRCNALKPDVMVITGDLVDGDVPTLGPSVSALRGLQSRYGTHFITGNHEYYSGANQWSAALGEMGINVLRNRRVEIGDRTASIDLIGVDDWSHRDESGYDLDQAVAGRDRSRAAVLLAHQPYNFEEAVKQGIGLQLSGHTHGGQFFPGTALIPLIYRYSAGLYRHGDGQIYVSRGTGFWGPPIRIGSPPEIVQITLVA